MQVGTVIKSLGKLLSDNAPALLTGFGAVGVVTTAVMAVKATPGAIESMKIKEFELQEEQPDELIRLTKREVLAVTWKHYVPAMLMGTTTICCIIGANSVNQRKQAVLVGMYTTAESMAKEYKDKVVEILGEKTDARVMDEVQQDRVSRTPAEGLIVMNGKVLCFDSWTGRYFESDMEALRKAENNINRHCINQMYASQNDFYKEIGISGTAAGEEFGWNTDNPLELWISAVVSDDGRPCLALDYRTQPKANFHKVW